MSTAFWIYRARCKYYEWLWIMSRLAGPCRAHTMQMSMSPYFRTRDLLHVGIYRAYLQPRLVPVMHYVTTLRASVLTPACGDPRKERDDHRYSHGC
jgi:hypothetical protein